MKNQNFNLAPTFIHAWHREAEMQIQTTLILLTGTLEISNLNLDSPEMYLFYFIINIAICSTVYQLNCIQYKKYKLSLP